MKYFFNKSNLLNIYRIKQSKLFFDKIKNCRSNQFKIILYNSNTTQDFLEVVNLKLGKTQKINTRLNLIEAENLIDADFFADDEKLCIYEKYGRIIFQYLIIYWDFKVL